MSITAARRDPDTGTLRVGSICCVNQATVAGAGPWFSTMRYAKQTHMHMHMHKHTCTHTHALQSELLRCGYGKLDTLLSSLKLHKQTVWARITKVSATKGAQLGNVTRFGNRGQVACTYLDTADAKDRWCPPGWEASSRSMDYIPSCADVDSFSERSCGISL